MNLLTELPICVQLRSTFEMNPRDLTSFQAIVPKALAHTDFALLAVAEVILTFVLIIPVQATVLLHEKFTATFVDDVPYPKSKPTP
jgi:hypothetical protein